MVLDQAGSSPLPKTPDNTINKGEEVAAAEYVPEQSLQIQSQVTI